MAETQTLPGGGGDVFSGLPLREYFLVFRRRRRWIIPVTVGVFVATAVVGLRLPDIYRSDTVIMVDPQKVPDNYVASTVSSSIADRLSTIQQQVMSPSRLKRLIDSLELYPELRGKLSEQQVIRKIQKATEIELIDPGGRRLSAFRIAFHSKNPEEAAQVANQLASMFIEENVKAREQQFQGTAEFLTNELGETKRQLEQKEQELGAIKSRYIMDLPESKQYHLEQLTNLRIQLESSADSVRRAQQEKVYTQSLWATAAPMIDLDVGSPDGVSVARPRQQPAAQKLESTLNDLQSRYGPNHPDVRKVKAQLDALKRKRQDGEISSPLVQTPEVAIETAPRPVRNPVLEGTIQRLDGEIQGQTQLQKQLQEKIDYHISKLERVPAFEQKIGGLMRDYDSLRNHYAALLDKKLSAEMASALESRQKGERFVILDPAVVPEKPYAPNRLLILLGGLLGGVFGGLGLAVLREMTDGSVRSEVEAARIVGRPILAAIPQVLTRQQRVRATLRGVAAVATTAACAALLGFGISHFSGRFF